MTKPLSWEKIDDQFGKDRHQAPAEKGASYYTTRWQADTAVGTKTRFLPGVYLYYFPHSGMMHRESAGIYANVEEAMAAAERHRAEIAGRKE